MEKGGTGGKVPHFVTGVIPLLEDADVHVGDGMRILDGCGGGAGAGRGGISKGCGPWIGEVTSGEVEGSCGDVVRFMRRRIGTI